MQMRNSFNEQAKLLEKFFDKAPMKRAFGMELSFNNDGQAVFDMPYNPSFDHSLGGVHGGVIATLLDNAGWFNVALHYDFWVATTDLHVQLLESVNGSALRATGQVIRTGKKLAVARMEVQDTNGRIVAIGSGTFSVTSVPF
jgi:acyl-CoA thioesterase